MKKRLIGWILAGILAVPLAAKDFNPKDKDLEALNPQYQAYLDEGLTNFIDSDFQKAVELFGKALEVKPGDETAEKALAEAEKKLSKIHAKENVTNDKELKRIKTFYKQKEYLVTFISLHFLLEKHPYYAEGKKFRAAYRKEMDSLSRDEARGSYKHLIYEGILSGLDGKMDAAVRLWGEALKLRPDDQITALAIEEMQPQAKPQVKPTPSGLASTVVQEENCDCDITSAPVKATLFEPFAAVVPSTIQKPVPATVPSVKTLESKSAHPAHAMTQKSLPGFTPASQPVQKPDEVSKPQEPAAQRTSASAMVQSETKSKPTPIPSPSPILEPASQEKPANASESGSELERARELMDDLRYPQAIVLLQSYLIGRPGDMAMKDALTKAISEQSAVSAKHYQKGLLAYAKGEFSEAIEEWKTTLKIDPTHPNAKKVLLRAFFNPR